MKSINSRNAAYDMISFVESVKLENSGKYFIHAMSYGTIVLDHICKLKPDLVDGFLFEAPIPADFKLNLDYPQIFKDFTDSLIENCRKSSKCKKLQVTKDFVESVSTDIYNGVYNDCVSRFRDFLVDKKLIQKSDNLMVFLHGYFLKLYKQDVVVSNVLVDGLVFSLILITRLGKCDSKFSDFFDHFSKTLNTKNIQSNQINEIIDDSNDIEINERYYKLNVENSLQVHTYTNIILSEMWDFDTSFERYKEQTGKLFFSFPLKNLYSKLEKYSEHRYEPEDLQYQSKSNSNCIIVNGKLDYQASFTQARKVYSTLKDKFKLTKQFEFTNERHFLVDLKTNCMGLIVKSLIENQMELKDEEISSCLEKENSKTLDWVLEKLRGGGIDLWGDEEEELAEWEVILLMSLGIFGILAISFFVFMGYRKMKKKEVMMKLERDLESNMKTNPTRNEGLIKSTNNVAEETNNENYSRNESSVQYSELVPIESEKENTPCK